MPPTNDLEARVKVKERRRWQNKHQTFTQPLERLYDVWNPQGRPSVAGLKATVAALQQLIADAIGAGKRLRALGSGWSFSRVAATEDWLLNTKPLNWVFPLSDRSVAENYAGAPDDLLFAQCGVAILELNNYLVGKGKSLKTSGASNGQTIAGALSTGTHGSALDVGGIPNYVVGLHLIVGPDRHVWLERESYPVVTDAFADRLDTELIRDDTLFNAALVSFGSFGIIPRSLPSTLPGCRSPTATNARTTSKSSPTRTIWTTARGRPSCTDAHIGTITRRRRSVVAASTPATTPPASSACSPTACRMQCRGWSMA